MSKTENFVVLGEASESDEEEVSSLAKCSIKNYTFV